MYWLERGYSKRMIRKEVFRAGAIDRDMFLGKVNNQNNNNNGKRDLPSCFL